MKKILFIALLFLSVNSIAQTQMSSKDIEMILDTNYIFFVYKDSVYSSEGCLPFTGIRNIAEYLRNDKEITPTETNKVFKYVMNWWSYNSRYNDIPQMPNLSKQTLDKLNANSNFTSLIAALKTIKYEVPSGIKTDEDFNKAALIVGIPENQIDTYNPNSEKYRRNWTSMAAYDLIKSEAALIKQLIFGKGKGFTCEQITGMSAKELKDSKGIDWDKLK